jgi:hypothetical protein
MNEKYKKPFYLFCLFLWVGVVIANILYGVMWFRAIFLVVAGAYIAYDIKKVLE